MPTFMLESSSARFDDTVRGQPLAIVAAERTNAIDARQSRVCLAMDARDGANWNLTKLAPLRFMSIDVIVIGLRAGRT
jgi:hypothetical protein